MKFSHNIKLSDLETELKENQKLIQMTAGYEDDEEDEGSDSEPSGDNLDEDELAEIIPTAKEKSLEPLPPKDSKNQKGKKQPDMMRKPSGDDAKLTSAQLK